MNKSILTAIGIALGVSLWILSGQIGYSSEGKSSDSIAIEGGGRAAGPSVTSDIGSAAGGGLRAQMGNDNSELASVRARIVAAVPRESTLSVRGKTEALRSVDVRAQLSSRVNALPFDKGQRVVEGDLLCRLDAKDLEARLAEARALVQQRVLEYDAAASLAAKGYRSETSALAAKAQLDAATARIAGIEVEMSYTNVRAPFDGIIEERPVEIGDFMRIGDVCARVVDEDPFLVVGQISEQDVGRFSVGDVGIAELITGESIEGVVRFIGKTADQATRTFRLELEVGNPEGTLRDGVTAEILINVGTVYVHIISPAILALNDEGVLGVRILDNDARVHFMAVEIVGDDPTGTWITGLPSSTAIITVGQDYVSEGQLVRVSLENDTDPS